jgi:hypothetical protein
MEDQLRTLSTYHLIYELLHDGKGNLYPEIEPISPRSIFDVLWHRHGRQIGDNVKSCVEWFLHTPKAGSQNERGTIATVARIRNIEEESVRKIESDDREQ